jgi:5-methylcytosine-specific restriction enzyme subunit McrC
MIEIAFGLRTRSVGIAHLELFDAPLTEWVISQFLRELDHLIKKGLRHEYSRVEGEERFLRGQLDVARQIRQGPGKQNYFQIRHDVFLPDGPENRLLKSALERVCCSTSEPSSWTLSRELRELLRDVPSSVNEKSDFEGWRLDRLMAHYRGIKPWCELILNRQMPIALRGDWRGISLLYPMERLFERYVEACLRVQLCSGAQLRTKPSYLHLCSHEASNIFRLEPDFMIRWGQQKWVLDTKWKVINQSDRRANYGLQQGDFYQLFAYGHKYLADQELAELIMIYPKQINFVNALPGFKFSEGLRLWVMPFDLENGCLDECHVAGLPVRPV